MKNYRETDPEFAAICERFAFEEVPNEPGQELEPVTRHLAILAALIGCQGAEAFKYALGRALDEGLTPVMAKEVVYQAADYLGLGRMLPFLDAANEVLTGRGGHMLEAWKAGHINRWLAANCFGDYYTRGGLDLRQRELITFCFLAAQGGCEPQLIAHARGNINMGSDPAFLRRVVSQCLPYIGYPRSLNALSAIDKAAEG